MTLSSLITKTILSYQNKGLKDTAILEMVEKFLRKKGLLILFPSILKNLSREIDKDTKTNTLFVQTAKDGYEIPKKVEEILNTQKETKKEITVNKTLIGGLRAEYKYKYFDLSVKNTLKNYKKELLKNL